MIRIEFVPMEHDGVRFTSIALRMDEGDIYDFESESAYMQALFAYTQMCAGSPVSVPVPQTASDEGEQHLRDTMIERARRLADSLGLDVKTMQPKEDADGNE